MGRRQKASSHTWSSWTQNPREYKTRIDINTPALAAAGKTHRGDNVGEAGDEAVSEDDNEEGPSTKPNGQIRHTRAELTTGVAPEASILVEGSTPSALNKHGTGKEGHAQHTINMEVMYAYEDSDPLPQYFSFSVQQMQLREVDEQGKQQPNEDDKCTDGCMFAGAKAYKDMETCAFMITDRLKGSYITTGGSATQKRGSPRETTGQPHQR